MAARVPVVAADAGGPAEIISHDVNGLLYPMGDRAALAGAMRDLTSDPQRLAWLPDGGTAVLAAYHPDIVGARLQSVYMETMQAAGR